MIINEAGSGGLNLDPLSNPGGASQALSGYQYYNQNGDVVTGNITTRSLSSPSISVSSNGLITASVSQNSGYVSSATKSATKQLTVQSGTTITPGTSQKTAVSSGRYTTGNVYVAGDSDLVASNIVSGKNIFGVTGTAQTLQTATVTIYNNYRTSEGYIEVCGLGGGIGGYELSGGIDTLNYRENGTFTGIVGASFLVIFWSDRLDANDLAGFDLTNLKEGAGLFYSPSYKNYVITGPNAILRLQ